MKKKEKHVVLSSNELVALHKEGFEISDNFKSGMYTTTSMGGLKHVEFKPLISSHPMSRRRCFNVTEIEECFSDRILELNRLLGKRTNKNILLSSLPGLGKTTGVYSLFHYLKEKYPVGWMFFDVTPGNLGELEILYAVLNDVASKIPNVRFGIFLDEIDSLLTKYPSSMKSLLDGSRSLDRSLVIGCTNEIKEINSSFYKNRPSRFEFREISSFDSEESKLFMHTLIKKLPKEVVENIGDFGELYKQLETNKKFTKNNVNIDVLSKFLHDFLVKNYKMKTKTSSQEAAATETAIVD